MKKTPPSGGFFLCGVLAGRCDFAQRRRPLPANQPAVGGVFGGLPLCPVWLSEAGGSSSVRVYPHWRLNSCRESVYETVPFASGRITADFPAAVLFYSKSWACAREEIRRKRKGGFRAAHDTARAGRFFCGVGRQCSCSSVLPMERSGLGERSAINAQRYRRETDGREILV